MLGLQGLPNPLATAAATTTSRFSTTPSPDPVTTGLLYPIRWPHQLRLPPVAAVRRGGLPGLCRARRRIRYDDTDVDDGGDGGGADLYGHNADLATLEAYSEGARGVALLVRAEVDGEEEEVLIFRGFSSLLSSGTSSDPSRSVLPARAVIKAVDVVKGPFDPSDIQYLERGLTLDDVKARVG